MSKDWQMEYSLEPLIRKETEEFDAALFRFVESIVKVGFKKTMLRFYQSV